MKPTKKPIVFKAAPGAFAQILKESEITLKKFRSSNLEQALRKGIEDGLLFVMPENKSFGYRRGSGPVSFRKVRLGGHEVHTASGMPDFNSPRLLTVEFEVDLFDSESEESRNETVSISVPSRFTEFYAERGDDFDVRGGFTRLEFKYSVADLRKWMKAEQDKAYAYAAKECNEEIERLMKRIVAIRGMLKGTIEIPRRSAFG